MNVNNVYIEATAVQPSQYPNGGLPEIAFAGRSNVGKSSLINKLVNRKSLARTSSRPGKTATLNFYNVENLLYFVDLPGYGYAQVSKSEKQKWGRMIETYLFGRQQLTTVVQLVDSRHAPSKDDLLMLNWIRQFKNNIIVVATKCDKLKKAQRIDNLKMISDTLQIQCYEKLIMFSATSGEGKEELWSNIREGLCLIKN